jgi:hypothetical protein
VLGGSTANDFINIGSANFAVNVVPEPGTVGLLVSGGLLLVSLRRMSLGRQRPTIPARVKAPWYARKTRQVGFECHAINPRPGEAP